MAMVRPVNNCSIFTPAGNKIASVFQNVYDEKLKREVVKKVSEFDIDEFIQASSSKTDLALLRAQMQETGQIPIIDDDVIQSAALMPQNIHELYNIVNSVEQQFNGLPDSIKSAFKDKDDFLNSLTSGTYNQRIQTHINKLVSDSVKAAQNFNVEKEEGDK